MAKETKAVAKRSPSDVMVNDRIVTPEEVRRFLCPLASDKELYMAMNIIKSYKLNPFKREVHLIKYSEKSPISIVVGYEVYLKRAERTGILNGWQVRISEDGQYATVTIHRKDWKEPFEWSVRLSEFSKEQATWKQIPEFMAKKVAIAQGFRLAFPDELGGMPYTKEEREVFEVEATNGKASVEMPKSKSEADKPENIYKDMLNRFKEVKKFVGDDIYYEVLKKHGYKYCNEIKNITTGDELMVEMGECSGKE